MPYKTITPDQASALLEEQPGTVYLDVRSQREFAAGHAEGAINIPIAEPDPSGQMSFNPEFLEVTEKVLPKDTALVVGCMSGKRSESACQLLEKAGYTNLANIGGGFGGAKDPTGRVVQPGWRQLGLPISTDTGEGVSYASLRKKALD
jgi:rhodanese-related sulfurtransferase